MTNGISNKLLPCPFCGGKASVIQFPVGSKAQGLYTVGCVDDSMCYAHVSHATIRFVSKSTAAQTWNTRKATP